MPATPAAPVFTDVPAGHPDRREIEAIYPNVLAAGELFEKLTAGGQVVKVGGGLRVVEIKGVGTFVLRTVSSTRGVKATIDVAVRGIGVKKLKFRP